MGRTPQTLSVTVPSFFRCPISLDVMRSPVSLCTGVTYDRSSITRWLDSGNTTCPATMQPLPSTDLVPNLTLLNLIRLWANSVPSNPACSNTNLIRDINSPNPLPALNRLTAFLSDPDVDDFAKNSVIHLGCSAALSAMLVDPTLEHPVRESVIDIIAKMLTADYTDSDNKKLIVADASLNLRTMQYIVGLLKTGRLESRTAAATVCYEMVNAAGAGAEIAAEIVGTPDLIEELLRLIGEAVEPGLQCLTAMLPVRKAKFRMVSLGLVPKLVAVLEAEVVQAAAAERALRLMEAAAGCAEGREAICQDAERCVRVVMDKMMKVGKEGTEAAVTVLWSVCHLYRDRRAIEAVTAGGGGITKFLLLMQSYCSPATRQKAGDLMKIFKVNTKSCLSGYDTKTTHIMPF